MPDFKIVPLATPFHHALRQKEQAQELEESVVKHTLDSAPVTLTILQQESLADREMLHLFWKSQGEAPRPQLLALDFSTLISQAWTQPE